MLNVPLAAIRGIATLYLSDQYLSVLGSIGFIALFGVAVLNGVVVGGLFSSSLLTLLVLPVLFKPFSKKYIREN